MQSISKHFGTGFIGSHAHVVGSGEPPCFRQSNPLSEAPGAYRDGKQFEVVHRCKPYPEYVECYAQVVKELKERDSHDKIQDREVTKRSLKSEKSDDPEDVDKFVNLVRLKGWTHSRLSGKGMRWTCNDTEVRHVNTVN